MGTKLTSHMYTKAAVTLTGFLSPSFVGKLPSCPNRNNRNYGWRRDAWWCSSRHTLRHTLRACTAAHCAAGLLFPGNVKRRQKKTLPAGDGRHTRDSAALAQDPSDINASTTIHWKFAGGHMSPHPFGVPEYNRQSSFVQWLYASTCLALSRTKSRN